MLKSIHENDCPLRENRKWCSTLRVYDLAGQMQFFRPAECDLDGEFLEGFLLTQLPIYQHPTHLFVSLSVYLQPGAICAQMHAPVSVRSL